MHCDGFDWESITWRSKFGDNAYEMDDYCTLSQSKGAWIDESVIKQSAMRELRGW
jgi:hypothetical protein